MKYLSIQWSPLEAALLILNLNILIKTKTFSPKSLAFLNICLGKVPFGSPVGHDVVNRPFRINIYDNVMFLV
jgi:hypothetical protein